MLLHGRIAEALLRLRPSLVERSPEIVARHLAEAGEDRRALILWRAAGERATERSAASEAVTHFKYASECLRRLGSGVAATSEEAEIYLGLSGALMSAEGYRSDTLWQATDLARRAAQRSGSLSLRWRAVFHTAPVFYGVGRNREYLEMIEEMEPLALASDDPWLKACALGTRGVAHYNRGEFLQGADVLRAARALTRGLPESREWRLGQGDVSVVVQCYALRCVARLGRLDEALEIGLDAECTSRSAGHPFSLAWALQNRAAAKCYVGEYASALSDAQEATSISQRYGFSARLGTNLIWRGIARAYLGELEQGIEDFRQGYRLWLGPGAVFHAAEFGTELGDLLVLDGRTSEACMVLDDVDRLAGLAECQRLRGVLALAGGELPVAERWLEDAITTARGQAALMFELRATTTLAEVLAARGEGPAGQRRLAEICDSFADGYQAPAVCAARSLLERLQS
jgi:tetratricopeptide (TPR) repeat protein